MDWNNWARPGNYVLAANRPHRLHLRCPPRTAAIVAAISASDPKRGKALERYYSEMKRILREMQRVLKPDRAAVLVVASSEIRQIDTQTQICLAEIGETVGFEVADQASVASIEIAAWIPAGREFRWGVTNPEAYARGVCDWFLQASVVIKTHNIVHATRKAGVKWSPR